tara:strand:- start:1632 stop:2408 length:777 start_codon:yes stop_codon:yes gene_type:complete
MIRISHWYGRLGNNIQQCAIAILVAQEIGGTFKQQLDHDIIEKYETTFGSSSEEQVSKFFYWEGPYREVNLSSEFITQSIHKVCKKFIFPHLRVPRISIPDDTIVIHIRSGDVFDKGVDNPDQYVPNPLDFYRQLLGSFDKALVVTEPDEYNPVVEELKKHSKVTVQSLSVEEDFATLMGARNIASSGVGTFAVAAALCSQRIERFYCSNVSISEHLNWHMLVGKEVEVHCMHLDNYMKPGEWRNTDEQRQFILDYKA